MMPALVVFGAKGLLGRELIAPKGWRLVTPDADITDASRVAAALDGTQTGVVVNAAAYTAVDKAESEPAAAFAVNRDGAGHIAVEAAGRGLAMIHVSTDYVFSGTGDRPLTEDDPVAPLSVYGASKLAGEAAVRTHHPRAVTLRTAWLFGIHGPCFPKTILRHLRAKDHVGVIDDQTGCPTPAAALAAAITRIAQRVHDRPVGDPGFGLFHFAGQPPTTWCGFTQAIADGAAERGIRVGAVRPITTADYPLPAKRPAFAPLDCSRILAIHGLAAPDWRDGLNACLPVFLEGS